MSDMVNAFWTCLNMPLSIGGLTYNLYTVILAGLVLDIIGLFVAKCILISLGKR